MNNQGHIKEEQYKIDQEANSATGLIMALTVPPAITGMAASVVYATQSTSWIDYLKKCDKLHAANSAITAGIDACRVATAAVTSFASPAVNAVHGICASPAGATASHHDNDVSRVTAASLAAAPAPTSAIGMVGHIAAAPATVYSAAAYGATALLNTHKAIGAVCNHTREMIGVVTNPVMQYGGGHAITAFSGHNYYGTCAHHYASGIPAFSAQCHARTSLVDYIYSNNFGAYTDHVIPSAFNSILARSSSGLVAVSKAMNHKFYGGDLLDIDHVRPDNLDRVIGVSDINSKSKFYGGGPALEMETYGVVRAINNDYDHYVVNQKREVYKSILDNYRHHTGIYLGDEPPVRYGMEADWSAVFVDKISNYVGVLDQYIATKDASLLNGMYFWEWQAMAASYSAGFAGKLEVLYARIDNKDNSDEYARRRYGKIIEQKCKIIYKLDLRIIFRNIIRFLFKNMEDEPEGEYVSSEYANIILKPSKTSLYANREYDFYFKHAA